MDHLKPLTPSCDGDRPPDDTVEPDFLTDNADIVPSASQPTVDIPPVNPDSENSVPASASAAMLRHQLLEFILRGLANHPSGMDEL